MAKKKKKRKVVADAIRVDHTDASIPDPSLDLMVEIARGIHLSVAGAAAVASGDSGYPNWDDLNQETKDYWLQGARCAYAIIAVRGGAKVDPLA